MRDENRFIRQYILKWIKFKEPTDRFIKEVQYKINRRPKGELNFSTPKKFFSD